MPTGRQELLRIAGTDVAPGERRTLQVPLATLATHTEITLPLHVVHGRRRGPRLFVSGAIHGDEINGVEIVHRLLKVRGLARLRGTLIAVPVVNVFGFLAHSRYLPDRRDLNRSFPGSQRGSLTARLAHLFMEVVVDGSTHGIDLHTAARHRTNLPQVRASLDHEETRRLACTFGAPVVLDARVRDGSLREAVRERGIPVLLYEAGEALRFDELAIRTGVRGILAVMRQIGMLPPRRAPQPATQVCRSSTWVRAPAGGILRTTVSLGAAVEAGQRLGVLADAFGEKETDVLAPGPGIVTGRHLLPVVNEGDALFHVARPEQDDAAGIDLAELEAALEDRSPWTDA
jgi:predicted deacylase